MKPSTIRGLGIFSKVPWVVLALACAVGLIFLLTSALGDERREHRDTLLASKHLQSGQYIPELHLSLLQGETVGIGAPDGHASLLLLYNTSCPHCEASLPAWRLLEDHLGRYATIQLVALSSDPVDVTHAYNELHGLSFSTATIAEPRLQSIFRSSLVPQILVVEADGRIVFSRLGRLQTEMAIDSVLSALRHHTAGVERW
jgi:peroxiredoxin